VFDIGTGCGYNAQTCGGCGALTAVDSLLARFISRFPLRLRRMGIKIISSEISKNTSQCYTKDKDL
jgi:hypothetical protein